MPRKNSGSQTNSNYARQAMDQMKYEIANEFGVNLGPDATARSNGSVGGEMTKRLVDLGKGLRSQVGTMFATKVKGPRYLEMAEGYVLKVALDNNDEICGYQYVNLGKMMDAIKKGVDPKVAYESCIGKYGRFDDAPKHIDPRKE